MALSEADITSARAQLLACLSERPSWSENDLGRHLGVTRALFRKVLDALLTEEVLLIQFNQAGQKVYVLTPPSISPAQRLEGPLSLLASRVLVRLLVKPDGSRGLERALAVEPDQLGAPLEELERLGWIERKRVGMLTIYRPRVMGSVQ